MLATPENHPIEIATIGTISFTDSFNEVEVSKRSDRFNSKKIGECKVEIYGGEGQIPHFHMYNLNKTFDTCICIYSNNYFSHGGKYTDKLNAKQCKDLYDWLKEPNTKAAVPMTNWQMIVTMWEGNNGDNCRFPESRKVKEQPRYDDMINYKDV